MRVEALSLLLVGAGLFSCALLISRVFSGSRLRGLLLALTFGFTLGIGFVPGHGEVIVAPVLAFLKKGGAVAALGVVYGLLWCTVALVAAKVCARRSLRRPQ